MLRQGCAIGWIAEALALPGIVRSTAHALLHAATAADASTASPARGSSRA